MHLGLIGGIGPAATDHYYRGLVRLHADTGKPLELTIAHADVHEFSRNLTNNEPKKQAEIFSRLIGRLQAAGARAAAVTSMGGHFCIRELEAISPLPIVNAIPEVAAEIRKRNLKRVGILGTRTVMESRVYGALPFVDVVLPQGDDLARTHESYVAMAITGRVTAEQRRTFHSIGEGLCRNRGAEAIILGGTDLFLAFEGHDCGFPVIDCALVHVAALHRKSIGDL